mgnify:CR=1 FL=1
MRARGAIATLRNVQVSSTPDLATSYRTHLPVVRAPMAPQLMQSERNWGLIVSSSSQPTGTPVWVMSARRVRAILSPLLMANEPSISGSLMSPFHPTVVRGCEQNRTGHKVSPHAPSPAPDQIRCELTFSKYARMMTTRFGSDLASSFSSAARRTVSHQLPVAPSISLLAASRRTCVLLRLLRVVDRTRANDHHNLVGKTGEHVRGRLAGGGDREF